MATQLAPDRMDLPPPPRTTSRGAPPRRSLPPPALSLDLTDMDRRVGWVRGDTLGFRGFGSSGEAARAAWTAHRALARRLDRRAAGGRVTPIGPASLTVASRGAREAILADGRTIATLLRPGAGSESGPDSFGFEIRLHAPTDELTMRAAAHLVYRTLRRSGRRWAMWSRDARHESAPTPEDVPRGARRAGSALVRVATLTAIIVLVALAARPFAVAWPVTLPVGVIAFAGLGAAAVGEANRRWQPRRAHPTRRAASRAVPGHTTTQTRRAG